MDAGVSNHHSINRYRVVKNKLNTYAIQREDYDGEKFKWNFVLGYDGTVLTAVSLTKIKSILKWLHSEDARLEKEEVWEVIDDSA